MCQRDVDIHTCDRHPEEHAQTNEVAKEADDAACHQTEPHVKHCEDVYCCQEHGDQVTQNEDALKVQEAWDNDVDNKGYKKGNRTQDTER